MKPILPSCCQSPIIESTRPSVHVVDDDPTVLEGLARLLRSAGYKAQLHGSAESFLAALDAAPADAAPGCALLDVAMPGMNGLALQRELALRASPLAVVFLTGHGDLSVGVTAMKAGAVDVLAKPVDEVTLFAAVDAAIERSRSAQIAATRCVELQRRIARLTPREREVMALVVQGRLNKQVAAAIGTVEKTVKVHRARVMEKMEAGSLAELVRLVDGLVDGLAPSPR